MVGMVLSVKEIASLETDYRILAIAIAMLILGSILFVKRQSELEQPLLDFRTFQNRIFTGGVLAATLMMVVIVGAELMTCQRFQLSADFSPLQAGSLVACVAIPAIPMALMGGAILHRVGFIPLIGGGFLVITVGLVFSTLTFRNDQILSFIGSLILIGIGAGLISSVSSTAIVGATKEEKAGMASSVEAVSYEFGSLLGVAILGSLMQLMYSSYAPTAVSDRPDTGVDHPEFATAARVAYDLAYQNHLLITAAIAAVSVMAMLYLFRGNSKSAAALGAMQNN